ncbi:hypothetical protein KBI52_10900 [Microvirga sp. HBU67558]|uniref:hypothetical protein n=1 Tax=Microvirga sp. HBU67558 TaxID=2824562 RepID=UPI001B388C60|nr:hypothetical protein [Microvirga sp. HBU67558]MBQ0820713.1 hypothetical protein [Microvirga sp. HBU67558]
MAGFLYWYDAPDDPDLPGVVSNMKTTVTVMDLARVATFNQYPRPDGKVRCEMHLTGLDEPGAVVETLLAFTGLRFKRRIIP